MTIHRRNRSRSHLFVVYRHCFRYWAFVPVAACKHLNYNIRISINSQYITKTDSVAHKQKKTRKKLHNKVTEFYFFLTFGSTAIVRLIHLHCQFRHGCLSQCVLCMFALYRRCRLVFLYFNSSLLCLLLSVFFRYLLFVEARRSVMPHSLLYCEREYILIQMSKTNDGVRWHARATFFYFVTLITHQRANTLDHQFICNYNVFACQNETKWYDREE